MIEKNGIGKEIDDKFENEVKAEIIKVIKKLIAKLIEKKIDILIEYYDFKIDEKGEITVIDNLKDNEDENKVFSLDKPQSIPLNQVQNLLNYLLYYNFHYRPRPQEFHKPNKGDILSPTL